MDYIFLITEKKFLNKEQIKRLSWLSFKDGNIYDLFLNKKGTIILCKLEESNLIVGWGFIYEVSNIPVFNIYVSKDYRRLGIGKQIFKIAYDIFGEMKVSRWGDVATKFFDEMGCNY